VSDDGQLDRFSAASFAPDHADPVFGGQARLDPSALNDAALIQVLPDARALDAPALAAWSCDLHERPVATPTVAC
jgi:hypothetical protein